MVVGAQGELGYGLVMGELRCSPWVMCVGSLGSLCEGSRGAQSSVCTAPRIALTHWDHVFSVQGIADFNIFAK